MDSSVFRVVVFYFPLCLLIMCFYWFNREAQVEYPNITINNERVYYDIYYNYDSTVVPFIYSFKNESHIEAISYNENLQRDNLVNSDSIIHKVNDNNHYILKVNLLARGTMYIVKENDTFFQKVYEGEILTDLGEYINDDAIYRVGISYKLNKLFYYNGYLEYKFILNNKDEVITHEYD